MGKHLVDSTLPSGNPDSEQEPQAPSDGAGGNDLDNVKKAVWLLKRIEAIVARACPMTRSTPRDIFLRQVLRDAARMGVYRLHDANFLG